MKFPTNTWRPNKAPGLFSFATLYVGLAACIALAYDDRRIGQMLWLATPVLLWLVWPVQNPVCRRVRKVCVFAWTMIFVADAMTRSYLLQAYEAAPDSALVLGAAANSNLREQSEYLTSNWLSISIWFVSLILCGVGVWLLTSRRVHMDATRPRWVIILLSVVLLTSGLAYASKSWRRLHPAVFWTTWTGTVFELRAGWADQQLARDQAMARAEASLPTLANSGPSTVVLVISDSVNRDNMAIYGYGRGTTPKLIAQKQQVGDQMVVLRNAWSADASTLPAMRNMFGFGAPDIENRQHLLALARAAGYKIWWMSNHDDIAVEQQHARFADVVEMLNRKPGRSGASMDGELLNYLQKALENPTERKLIVVHLLGAHPHYSLRFPPGENPYNDDVDAIERKLIETGRSIWVRRSRQDYDAAMLYHDSVVAQTLQLARTTGRTTEKRSWMYLSDHGQEVGHSSDRTGHSPSTASGYRIPAIVWRNDWQAPQIDLAMRPFRSDWMGWTMMELLGIQWAEQINARNVLNPNYIWQALVLKPDIKSFSQ